MTIDTAQMLRQLGLAGAANARSTGAAPTAPARTDEAAFAELLNRARDGTLQSSRPIEVDIGAGVKLSDEQLARLSLAADRAEAAGLRTALVLIDDQRLIMDVHQRTIIGAAKPEQGVLEGIDGVIDLASLLAPAQAAPPSPGPPNAIDSPAVARLLAAMDGKTPDATI